jgi:uncharacterized protein (DUF433 family)
MATDSLIDRITHNPRHCGGRACIRGLRVRVSDSLDRRAVGATRAEILRDFANLEHDDITAALSYAARETERRVVIAAE